MDKHPMLERYERECERIRQWVGQNPDHDPLPMNIALNGYRNPPPFDIRLAMLMDDMALAIRALSHAAGHDGEQCRAASGDREALATRLRELICEYWDLAYDEGVDKRNSDTPAGDANRVGNEIETIIRALSRGVPEGMVLVPRVPTEAMCDAPGERGWAWKNEDEFSADDAESVYRAMIEAAIAAQRKEGE